MNGLPVLTGDDFTLNNLSRQPERREQVIEGSPFVVMTWHSVLAAVKPGDFSLSVETPVSVRINTHSAQDTAIAARMGPIFLQSLYNGITPKELKITSSPTELKVLPLPTQGQPRDFSGAVGDFQVSSDISPANAAAGDPLTLRLHIRGSGNFDRVDSTMLDHLERWKTYRRNPPSPRSTRSGTRAKRSLSNRMLAAPTRRTDRSGTRVQLFQSQYETLRACPKHSRSK